MPSKPPFNLEKIGVYTALLIAFWTIISQMFSIKDEISLLRGRIKAVEIKIDTPSARS